MVVMITTVRSSPLIERLTSLAAELLVIALVDNSQLSCKVFEFCSCFSAHVVLSIIFLLPIGPRCLKSAIQSRRQRVL